MIKILVNGREDHHVIDDPAPGISVLKPGSLSADCLEVTVRNSTGDILWESGAKTFTPQLRYKGKKLKPKSIYTISVVLSGNTGVVAEAESSFETGFMGTAWTAWWIEPVQDNAVREKEIPFYKLFAPNPDFFGGHDRLKPCREIRKTVLLDSPPVKGRIYMSAHGIYSLNVNGRNVEGDLFAPGTSAYAKKLYYQVYDVTGILQGGENEIRIILADGWWIGRIGISGDSCQYGDRLGMILEADIDTGKGTRLKICSDETFVGRRSRIDYADLFIGQRTDFSRKEGGWENCSAVDYETDILTAQPLEPVEIYGDVEPRFLTTSAGELLADFGFCMAGVVDIEVECEAGREVTLDFCEILDNSGNFLRNILGRNKDQRDVFITGKGRTRFEPRFTYHGFRYVRVTGLKRNEIVELKARPMGTRVVERGLFTCSDERLNLLQQNIKNSARSNLFYVPTDCPQREKAGWTGDMVAFAPTGCFNYHIDGFISAWLGNMRCEQFESGEIPVVIPDYPMQEKMQSAMGGSSSSVWSDAAILVPWQIYQSYGDLQILEENVEMMRRWLSFAEEQCRLEPSGKESRSPQELLWNDYLFTKGYHFGDWFIPSFVRHESGVMEATAATRDVTGSCAHAIALDTYIRVLTELDKYRTGRRNFKIEIEDKKKRLAKVRKAIIECYVDQSGRVRGDLQGLYVIVLKSGATDGELQKKLVDRLCELIIENGTRLDTGFVSTPHLLDVLADNDRMDLALELLFQTKSPSWLYMVEKGATSIWENWEAVKPDGTVMPSSFNHYALASVGDFLYRRIGGIDTGSPGYRDIRFSPYIHCGLTSAQAELETAYGTVSCSWEWRGGECEIALTVPYGCRARFAAGGKEEAVPSGTHIFIFTK